jgi:hypothetical protein
MDRTSFQHVADLICDNPVFQRASRCPQRAVEHQLAMYCDRVSKALQRLKRGYLVWPGRQPRRIIKLAFGAKGFPGCIGVLDGSLIQLSNKPQVLGELYWCQKKMYVVSDSQHIQVYCVCLTTWVDYHSTHS